MKTNDVILFGVGLAVGYFVKSSLDKRNAVTSTQVGDENYVFSQKYKDCEAKINSQMAVSEYAGKVDLVALKKSRIEECMNGKGVPVMNAGKVQTPTVSEWLTQQQLREGGVKFPTGLIAHPEFDFKLTPCQEAWTKSSMLARYGSQKAMETAKAKFIATCLAKK